MNRLWTMPWRLIKRLVKPKKKYTPQEMADKWAKAVEGAAERYKRAIERM